MRWLCFLAAAIASVHAHPVQLFRWNDDDFYANIFGSQPQPITSTTTPEPSTNAAWSMLFKPLESPNTGFPKVIVKSHLSPMLDVIAYTQEHVNNCKCFDIHAQPFLPPKTSESLVTHCTTGTAGFFREYYCYNLYTTSDALSACSFFCRC